MIGRLSSAHDGTHLRKHRPDHGIALITGILLLISMVVIYSVSPALAIQAGGGSPESYFITRQVIHIALGLLAFGVAASVPLQWWRGIQPLLIGASVVTSILLLIPGVGQTVNGATRWIALGPITFQPAELLKFTLLIYCAAFMAERVRLGTVSERRETTYPMLTLMGVIGFMVVILQKDLGTMFSVAAIITSILYVAGVGWRDLAIMGGSMLAAGAVSIALFPHRLVRIVTFLNPGEGVDSVSYHINQALIAIGSGGFFGKGLGQSIQVYGYLPEAETDSIFAITAEKFGFLGSIIILIMYVFLFTRLLNIVNRAPNVFFKLLATGIFAWLFSHSVINIGAMLGLLPLTGITLPLLSIGGSSMIFIMTALGVMFNISRYTQLGRITNKARERRNEGFSRRRGDRRSRYAYQARARRT